MNTGGALARAYSAQQPATRKPALAHIAIRYFMLPPLLFSDLIIPPIHPNSKCDSRGGKQQPLMTIPEPHDKVAAAETAKQKSLRSLDRAYACYAYVGLFTIALLFVVTVPVPTPDAREGYGMALVLPGTLLPIAFVAAIVLTVKWRRHKPLRLLGLSTLFLALLFLLAGVSDCCGDGRSEYVLDAFIGIFGCCATFVPAWWFAIGRRRYRDEVVTDT